MRVRLTVTTATIARVPAAGRGSSIGSCPRVGGQGKPVRLRRGPATVTGDAPRTPGRGARGPPPPPGGGGPGSHWVAQRPGKARVVGPEARRPAPAVKPIRPRGKG